MTDTDNTTTASDDAQIVELTRQPIDLYKILKFEGLVGSGGEAKLAISEGHVTLNGVVETQKRKKIVSGDTIEFAGTVYRVHCDEALQPAKAKLDAEPAEVGKQHPRTAAKPARSKPAPKKAGRKAIGIKN